MSDIIQTAASSVVSTTPIQVVALPSTADGTVEPEIDSTRTTQQIISPSAIVARFNSLIGQWPVPANQFNIGTSDVGFIRFRLGDGSLGPDNAGTIGFQFQGTANTYVKVELATSFFVDSVSFANAYPFGSNINTPVWGVERLKTAHFPPSFGSKGPLVYNLNQLNQDGEFIVIKNFTGVPHVIYLYYYWRAIINEGGAKS